jgi:hypothetical protein
MEKLRTVIAQASRGSRLVFLLGFFLVILIQGIWFYHRFHFSAPFWLMVIWAMPWLELSFPLGNLVPMYLRPAAHAALMAFGFATNTALSYVLVRAVWFYRQRSNNSFKPTPLRGAA